MRASTETAVDAGVIIEETPSRSRRIAWAVVVAIGCAFSYSIGLQNGAATGLREADARLSQINEFLLNSHARGGVGSNEPSPDGYPTRHSADASAASLSTFISVPRTDRAGGAL